VLNGAKIKSAKRSKETEIKKFISRGEEVRKAEYTGKKIKHDFFIPQTSSGNVISITIRGID
jgi:hypothetical protein